VEAASDQRGAETLMVQAKNVLGVQGRPKRTRSALLFEKLPNPLAGDAVPLTDGGVRESRPPIGKYGGRPIGWLRQHGFSVSGNLPAGWTREGRRVRGGRPLDQADHGATIWKAVEGGEGNDTLAYP